MKKLITISILAAMIAAGTTIKGQNNPQEYLGLPGDNLNLYAVMKLFQESKTLEDFERNLNDEKNRINNLDLNGDNYIDYIRVIDNVDGNVHNIVLQVPVSKNEAQDVAVFTVERLSDGQVMIQLTGDEDLYGRNYIIEPIFDESVNGETPNPGYTGNVTNVYGRNVTIIRTTPVQIAAWPVISFIYSPSYIVWHSGWYWGYYPSYWHAWHPFYWHYYYGYHYNMYDVYYGYYRRWDNHRYAHWNDNYYNNRRTHSSSVRGWIQSGNHNITYSHPEQRRDGEAVYTKTHSSQSRRTRSSTLSNTNEGRTGAVTDQDRRSAVNTRNTATRRSSTNVTNQPSTERKSGVNRGTSRRGTSAVTGRSADGSVGRQNAVTNRSTRQSNSTVSNSGRRSSGNSKTSATVKQDKKTKKSEKENNSRRK